jgi:hypothetical protein
VSHKCASRADADQKQGPAEIKRHPGLAPGYHHAASGIGRSLRARCDECGEPVNLCQKRKRISGVRNPKSVVAIPVLRSIASLQKREHALWRHSLLLSLYAERAGALLLTRHPASYRNSAFVSSHFTVSALEKEVH